MKTPDSYWSDPTADELVQRHRIHSGLFQQTPATTTSQRPQLGATKSTHDENLAVAPLLAREHIESLHQNSHAALLYGKNNVYLEPVSKFICTLYVIFLSAFDSQCVTTGQHSLLSCNIANLTVSQ